MVKCFLNNESYFDELYTDLDKFFEELEHKQHDFNIEDFGWLRTLIEEFVNDNAGSLVITLCKTSFKFSAYEIMLTFFSIWENEFKTNRKDEYRKAIKRYFAYIECMTYEQFKTHASEAGLERMIHEDQLMSLQRRHCKPNPNADLSDDYIDEDEEEVLDYTEETRL